VSSSAQIAVEKAQRELSTLGQIGSDVLVLQVTLRTRVHVAVEGTIAAAATGLVTEATREEGPFGFCLFSPAPGHFVAVDGFYIGNLKDVGKVCRLTAVEVFSRVAFIWIIAGVPNAGRAVAFFQRV